MAGTDKKKQSFENEQTADEQELSDLQAEESDSSEPENAAETSEYPQKPQMRRTLFVRSLPASVTTDTLTEFFSQSYPIKHAIVVVNPQTKESRGFGFVTLADNEDAARALQEFNGTELDGKKLRIEIAEPRHRDAGEDGVKAAPGIGQKIKEEKEKQRLEQAPPKLIVRNLPWSVDEEALADLFRSFGKIKSVNLPRKGKKHPGFGFVLLRGRKNAEKALESVNGKEVDGRTLAVDWAVDKKTWEGLQAAENNEAKEKDEEDEEMGDVEDAESSGMEAEYLDEDITIDEDEDEDEEEDEEEGEDEEEEGDEEDDGEDERNTSTVFIRNLPFSVTDESLYGHFRQFGPLRYARIVVDHETERPRGTGFVCFWKADDARACLREAPKRPNPVQDNKTKVKPSALKHSVLQDESEDPSGRFTMGDRVLQVSPAVSKTRATQLEAEASSRRDARERDKRRLFLLSEGTIPSGSPLYEKLTPAERNMRDASAKQRQKLARTNPALHVSLTRLSVRNMPRSIDSKALKALAREAVVGFAKDVRAGLRQPLPKEELERSKETMDAAEEIRKKKGKGIVKQAKVVFESKEGSRVSEKIGAGRSRGYGFVEYTTHRAALMGLRWLNGHAVGGKPKDESAGKSQPHEGKKRLIVEFAMENATVVKRRREREANVHLHKERGGREQQKQTGNKENRDQKRDNPNGKSTESGKGAKKRKRDDGKGYKSSGSGASSSNGTTAKSGKNAQKGARKDTGNAQEGKEKDNKIAMRNRIIAKKRMMRKGRKG